MITAFSEVSEDNQMASKTTVERCFKIMQVHSQAADNDICHLILKCLDLMTDRQEDPMTIFTELKTHTVSTMDLLLRRTLNMEEVRNGLGTEALDSLSENFYDQGLALSKLRASTLNRHELVSSFPALHPILTSVISAPPLRT